MQTINKTKLKTKVEDIKKWMARNDIPHEGFIAFFHGDGLYSVDENGDVWGHSAKMKPVPQDEMHRHD